MSVTSLEEEIRSAATPRPVFVGGCSRSGTTLLGAMLGVGADRLTVPEAEFKWQLLAHLGTPGPDVDLAAAAAFLRRDWKFRFWGCDLPTPVAGSRAPYAGLVSAVVLRHGRRVGKPAPALWIDHTPGNIRCALTLARLFTDARFVNVVRDGRAVAASVLPLDWGPNDVIEAARHWATQIALGLAAEQALGGARVLTVRYEDLVAEPDVVLRRICAFIDTPFDPAMLGTREYRVPGYSVAQHGLVGSAPDRARVDGWRGTLSRRQVETFEDTSGELLAYLGYELDYGVLAHRLPPLEHLRSSSVSVLRRWSVNRARRLLRRKLAEAGSR